MSSISHEPVSGSHLRHTLYVHTCLLISTLWIAERCRLGNSSSKDQPEVDGRLLPYH